MQAIWLQLAHPVLKACACEHATQSVFAHWLATCDWEQGANSNGVPPVHCLHVSHALLFTFQ